MNGLLNAYNIKMSYEIKLLQIAMHTWATIVTPRVEVPKANTLLAVTKRSRFSSTLYILISMSISFSQWIWMSTSFSNVLALTSKSGDLQQSWSEFEVVSSLTHKSVFLRIIVDSLLFLFGSSSSFTRSWSSFT